MYLQKLLVPSSLSCVYPTSFYFNKNIGLYTILLTLGLALLWKMRANSSLKILSLGIIFFFITLSPLSQLYSTSDSIIDDRYIYLPSLGIMLILACAFKKISNLKNQKIQSSLKFLFIIYLFILMAVSWQRVKVWKNSETLWTEVIEKYPTAVAAYNNRGAYYLSINKMTAALRDFNKAVVLNPHYALAHFNKGNALFAKNAIPEAIESYSKALILEPKNTGFLNNRGNAFFLNGQYAEALKDYNASIAFDPKQIEAYLNRGMLYVTLKKYNLALGDFTMALSLDPHNQIALDKKKELERK